MLSLSASLYVPDLVLTGPHGWIPAFQGKQVHHASKNDVDNSVFVWFNLLKHIEQEGIML